MASTMEILQGSMACACKSWRMQIYCVWTPSGDYGDFLKWRVAVSVGSPNCSPRRCMVVCLEGFFSMESTGCQYYYFSLPLVLVPPFPIYACCKINIPLYAGCLYGKFTYSHMQPVIFYQKLTWKSLHMHLMHPLAAVYGCLLKTSWCALLH